MADGVDEPLDDLVARADLDALVHLVDARCTNRDWEGLLRLRDRARWAVHTGRQLWPAATLAEYRLALLAPAEWAARVVDEGSGRFTIGPLTEVVAQHHRWSDLAPHLPPGPRAAFVAHECVLRGETVDGTGLPDVLDLPYALAPWEPAYALAEYTTGGAEFPSPPLPPAAQFAPVEPGAGAGAERVDDDELHAAVRQLLEPWTASSNGRVEVVAVEGGGLADALGALGLPAGTRAARLAPAAALAWLAWAGASGGAHGRRRGAALGRFAAWWTLAAIGGVAEHWPVAAEELGELAGELTWWWWDAGEASLGWALQLAAHDPADGLTVALSARDAA